MDAAPADPGASGVHLGPFDHLECGRHRTGRFLRRGHPVRPQISDGARMGSVLRLSDNSVMNMAWASICVQTLVVTSFAPKGGPGRVSSYRAVRSLHPTPPPHPPGCPALP